MTDNTNSSDQLNNVVSSAVANAGSTVSTVVSNTESKASSVVTNIVNNAEIDADKVANTVENKVDNLANNLDNKIDSTLNNSTITSKIIQKGDDFLTKIAHFIEKGMDDFASLSQKSVDTIIEKTALPDQVKTELIKDVNSGIIDASLVVKNRIESLENEGEVLFNKDFPVLEKKLASFLKELISKIKNFADKTIKNCENDIHKLGDKIKSLVSHHNDENDKMSSEDVDMQFTVEPLDVNLIGDTSEYNCDTMISN